VTAYFAARLNAPPVSTASRIRAAIPRLARLRQHQKVLRCGCQRSERRGSESFANAAARHSIRAKEPQPAEAGASTCGAEGEGSRAVYAARVQQPQATMPMIGYLYAGSPDRRANLLRAFRQD
jgi:hypothetical protein